MWEYLEGLYVHIVKTEVSRLSCCDCASWQYYLLNLYKSPAPAAARV
jgi:hypothetical protein